MINGRPDWLFENGRKSYNVIDEIESSFPCLVFAYIATELANVKNGSEKVVPFDVIELKNKNDNKVLSLTPGDYTIVVLDAKGKKQCFSATVN
jgi:hypothetical protein